MNIEKEIFNLLSTQGKVVLSGFGTFITENEAAKIHPVNHDFNPPSKSVLFKNNEADYDNILANHLSTLYNLPKAEVLNIVANFINDVKKNIQSSGKHVFEDFGVLSLNQSGAYSFELNSDLNLANESFGMENFNSPAIKREKVEPQKITPKKKRSKVWIILLILFILIVSGTVGTYFLFPDYADKGLSFIESKYNEVKGKLSKNESSAITVKSDDKMTKKKSNVKKQEKKNILSEALNQLTDTLTKTVTKDTTHSTKEKNVVVKEKPAVISGKMYYIVAGSFKSKENAEKYASELKNKSYPNALMLDNPVKGFYTVAYDRFSDKASADAELKKINSNEKSGSWIICE